MLPRKLRVQQPGMIHHVIARGNNKENIFNENADKIRYLQLIERYKKRHMVKLLAYCLMDNHVHLLIKQGEESLSKTMQGIQQSYTQYYNKKYNSIGHVFHQRFKSIPVADDAYLLSLIAYIHNNPKEAGLVSNLNDYRWSSHIEIVKPSKKNIADVDFLFDIIDRDVNEVLPEYLWLLGEISEEHVKSQYLKGKKLEERKSEIYIEEMEEIKRNKYLEIDQVKEFLEYYIKLRNINLRNANKSRLIVLLCDEFCRASNKEIGHIINITGARVSSIRNEYLENKWEENMLEMYKEMLEELEKYIHNNK